MTYLQRSFLRIGLYISIVATLDLIVCSLVGMLGVGEWGLLRLLKLTRKPNQLICALLWKMHLKLMCVL